MVVALLGAPDALSPNPHGFRPPMRWYRQDRVLDAEASETFRERFARHARPDDVAGGTGEAGGLGEAGGTDATGATGATGAAAPAPAAAPTPPPLRSAIAAHIEHLEWLDDAAHIALFHTPRRPRMRRPRRPAPRPPQLPVGQRFEVLRLF
jgi:hypothetical protein